MNSYRHISILFGVTLGFFATISQVVLMREFWTIPGLGELSFGLVLCSWLLDIAVGAELGKKIRFSGATILFILGTCTLLLPTAILWVRHYELIFSVSPGAPLDMPVFLILCVTAPLPAALVSGILFTSYARQFKSDNGFHVQRVYMAEGAGAVVAGLSVTFVFLEVIDPLTTVLLGQCVLFAGVSAALQQKSFRNSPEPRVPKGTETSPLLKKRLGGIGYRLSMAWFLFALSITVVTWAFSLNDRSLALAFETQPVRGAFVACDDTRYQRLCLGRNAEQYQLYRDGRLAYVFPDPYDRPRPVHLAMIQHRAPKRVLIIGGGVANRLDAALGYGPETVDYLDFDPEELPFAMTFQDHVSKRMLSHPKVHRHSDYHRRFLQQHANQFDVIVQFASPPFTAAENAAHTVSFYTEIRRALADEGILAVVSAGSANVASPPAAQLMANRYRTLKAVFKHVVPLIDVQSIFYAAKRDVLSMDPSILTERLTRADASLADTINLNDVFSRFRITRSWETVSKTAGELNVDEYPRAFLHAMELRRWIRTSSLDTLTEKDWEKWRTNHSGIRWSLPVGALILFGIVLPLIMRHRSMPAELLSIGATGLCGMGLEIVLIYRFSVVHGGLYHHLAWLLASFMAGLALGAFWGARQQCGRWGKLGAELSVIGALLFAVVLIFADDVSPWGVAIAMLLSGGVTGYAFPVFLKTLVPKKKDAAAHLVAMDHAGAALGAILVATLWLPELGLHWTCVLMLLFKVPLSINYLTKNG